ncbi:dITP- and XTP- hydrolase [Escherichia coli]|nr:dITP- and XTP- hydrolase [Escherichia coli]
MNEIISAAVLLILIMDPLGNLPIFMSVLKHTEPKKTAGNHGARVAYCSPGDAGVPVCG